MDTVRDEVVGFAGLGLMGQPMALRIAQSGQPMVVWTRSSGKAEGFAAAHPDVQPASTPADLARRSGILVLMLADSLAVEQVVAGEDGVIAGLQPGGLLIDMGTTSVALTRDLAARTRGAGADLVDAPVSGGVIGAEQGTLSIMAGGTAESVERARRVFDLVGARIVHIGESGTGQVAKAANQVIVGLNIGAAAEAFVLAERAGAPLAAVREALSGGFAASRVLELHGQRMIDEEFAPGGRCRTQRKDLQQALELAAELGVDMPATRLCRELYDGLLERGDGDLDHSALVREIRARSGFG